MNYNYDTRRNNSSQTLVIPKVKTESGKRSLRFQGALVFNKLPENGRDENSFILFKKGILDLIFLRLI